MKRIDWRSPVHSMDHANFKQELDDEGIRRKYCPKSENR
jgi:hypothetical protein